MTRIWRTENNSHTPALDAPLLLYVAYGASAPAVPAVMSATSARLTGSSARISVPLATHLNADLCGGARLLPELIELISSRAVDPARS